MANPQAEDGHVDIANEIMEAFSRIRIPGETRQVLDFILRKTYGWHKKQDSISLTQFEKATGLKRNQVCRAIKKLILMNIIVKGSDNTVTVGSDNGVPTISSYEFQKDFEKWVGSYNAVTSDKSVTEGGYKTPKRVVTKVSPTKETIQKKTKQKKVLSDDEFLASLKEKFTWVDFEQEMAKIDAWLLANPGRQKTRRFVVKWLSKVQKPMQIKQKVVGDYPRAEDVLRQQGMPDYERKIGEVWKSK